MEMVLGKHYSTVRLRSGDTKIYLDSWVKDETQLEVSNVLVIDSGDCRIQVSYFSDLDAVLLIELLQEHIRNIKALNKLVLAKAGEEA
jgi:hypothetical protein